MEVRRSCLSPLPPRVFNRAEQFDLAQPDLRGMLPFKTENPTVRPHDRGVPHFGPDASPCFCSIVRVCCPGQRFADRRDAAIEKPLLTMFAVRFHSEPDRLKLNRLRESSDGTGRTNRHDRPAVRAVDSGGRKFHRARLRCVVRSDARSPVRSDRFPRHQERKRQGVYVNRFTPQKTRTNERNAASVQPVPTGADEPK